LQLAITKSEMYQLRTQSSLLTSTCLNVVIEKFAKNVLYDIENIFRFCRSFGLSTCSVMTTGLFKNVMCIAFYLKQWAVNCILFSSKTKHYLNTCMTILWSRQNPC